MDYCEVLVGVEWTKRSSTSHLSTVACGHVAVSTSEVDVVDTIIMTERLQSEVFSTPTSLQDCKTPHAIFSPDSHSEISWALPRHLEISLSQPPFPVTDG